MRLSAVLVGLSKCVKRIKGNAVKKNWAIILKNSHPCHPVHPLFVAGETDSDLIDDNRVSAFICNPGSWSALGLNAD